MPSIHINLIDVFNNVSMNLKIFGEMALAKRRYEKKPMKANIFVPQIILNIIIHYFANEKNVYLKSRVHSSSKNYHIHVSLFIELSIHFKFLTKTNVHPLQSSSTSRKDTFTT